MAMDYDCLYDLPRVEKFHVDGSGISVFGVNGCGFVIQDHRDRINFLSEFNKKIKDRGDFILTVGPVFEEIVINLKFYKNIITNIKNFGKRKTKLYLKGALLGSNENRPIDRKNMDQVSYVAKKGLREYRRLCDSLEDGMAFHGLPQDVDLSRERAFVDSYDRYSLPNRNKLSFPDKELVVSALASGNGNGLLSGDRGMIRAYLAGVRKFGLEGCCVCDSGQGRSYLV
jgi:hypothetical protein